MLQAEILKVVNGEDLSYEETYEAMNQIMQGNASEVVISSFLTALSSKGEYNAEIAGSAGAMRDNAMPVNIPYDTLDIVGTGGDRSYSFNISTTSGLVLAAAGVKVAKHGNRSASSKSGAADCLEALGVNLYQSPELVRYLLDEVGICFMFAQNYHKSMANVGPVRQELGIKTVFNLLGPMTNPAKPTHQVLGVYSEDLIEPLADVIKNLGVRRGAVIFGQDVMDEVSISAKTSAQFFDTETGEEKQLEIDPRSYGFPQYTKDEIVGGSPEENAEITRSILSGQERGAKRDIVLLNTAVALYVAGRVDSIEKGLALAEEAIDSGRAEEVLNRYIELSHLDINTLEVAQ